MPKFVTYECAGYRLGLRSHDETKTVKRVKVLTREHYHLPPYFNGSNIYFDFWVVATKTTIPNTVFRYEWTLSSPDSRRKFNFGQGVIDTISCKVCKDVIDVGHMSMTGQYRLDVIITNNQTDEKLFYVVDFKVHDLDQFIYTIILATIFTLITAFMTFVTRACGLSS